MAIDLETVVKQLEDSGIVAAGKLKEFIPPKASPKDGEALLRELYKQNLLTKFQAQQFAQSRAKALILGNYTIQDKIGSGGMGQVFKAEHRRMERTVAIKMLPPAMTKDAAAVARFQREVKAAAKLRHPNIVAADDADEARGVYFLVMEYIEGSDLSVLVKKNGPFPVAKAVNYILQAARGLEFAHGEGVVHRDIKPANLLLDKKGVVKILDMGLARIESSGNAATQAELTGSGAVMGTVDYMAPEQALDTKHADARADIYSLGCSLYYALVGKPIYEAESITAKLLAHQNKSIPELRNIGDEVSDALEAVFQKMVAKKVEDRFQSMSEVVAALEQCSSGQQTSLSIQQSIDTNLDNSEMTFLRDMPVHATHKPKPTKKTVKPAGEGASKNKNPNRNQALWIGAGAMGFLAVLLGVIVILRNHKGEEVGRLTLPPGHTAEVQETATQPAIVPNVATKVGNLVTTLNEPPFEQWMKNVAALGGWNQVEAVVKKMQQLNPGFDGKVKPKIENGVVTDFSFLTDSVTDISPVSALVGLKVLSCYGSGQGKGNLSDLSPLQGMKLTTLKCFNTQVSDLSPLQGLPLTNLETGDTLVADLSPLKGMKLTLLHCGNTQISDLSPLKGMPLTSLVCSNTRVSDLSPLRGMSLTQLNCLLTRVSNLLPLQGMPLTSLNCDNTQVSDLSPLKGMPLKGLFCSSTQVSDLSPVQGTPLTDLSFERTRVSNLLPLKGAPLKVIRCRQSWVSDLSPLAGMLLTEINFPFTRVSDLAPLKGMPLIFLDLAFTQVLDLSPLKGAPLTRFNCGETPVSDLSPLQGMSLADVTFTPRNITQGMDVFRRAKSLQRINAWPRAYSFDEFWKKYDAGEFARRTTKFNTPAFQQWMKDVAILSGEQQVEAVAKKLQEFNPGFDGKVTHKKIEGRTVRELHFVTDSVTDISPLRALAGLKSLRCRGSGGGKGRLHDLSPLQGMPLTELDCVDTQVSDLSPLKGLPLTKLLLTSTETWDLSPLQGMPLTTLDCTGTQVFDLSPLTGMPLKSLNCGSTPVFDLSPLKGMPLDSLLCGQSSVFDLSPLQGLPLTMLSFDNTPVWDLSPLRGMKLTSASLGGTKVTDLSLLQGMKLTYLKCDINQISDLSPLKEMPLTKLICRITSVSDLSPLNRMPLTFLDLAFTSVSDPSPLLDCKSLKSLNVTKTALTAAGVVALQKALPNCKIDWDGLAQPALTAGIVEDIDVLLLGDGYVHRWAKGGQTAWDQFFAGRRLLNDGVAGLGVSGLIGRLESLRARVRPRVVILQIGFNDLKRPQDVSITVTDYKQLVTRLRECFPQAVIVVTSVITGDAPLVAKARLLNAAIRPLADDRVVYFVDLEPVFLDAAGQVRTGMISGVKMTPQGYERWAEAMVPLVNRLLTAAPKSAADLPGKAASVAAAPGKPITTFNEPAKPKTPQAASPIDPNRRAAEWVIGKGGVVDVAVKNAWQQVWTTDRLPNEPFQVATVTLEKGMSGEGTKLLSGLTALVELNVNGSKLTDDDDVRPLGTLTNLELLNLEAVPIGDAALSHLSSLSKLTDLRLKGTKITAAGVAALQKALPNCKIEWDDPAKPTTSEPAASGTK